MRVLGSAQSAAHKQEQAVLTAVAYDRNGDAPKMSLNYYRNALMLITKHCSVTWRQWLTECPRAVASGAICSPRVRSHILANAAWSSNTLQLIWGHTDHLITTFQTDNGKKCANFEIKDFGYMDIGPGSFWLWNVEATHLEWMWAGMWVWFLPAMAEKAYPSCEQPRPTVCRKAKAETLMQSLSMLALPSSPHL